MFIGFYILCLIGGLLLGALIHQSIQPKCKHSWKLLENNKIFRFREGRKDHTGYIKFYECDNCKKLKKEQIELD